jgi:putative tributyrin esterase
VIPSTLKPPAGRFPAQKRRRHVLIRRKATICCLVVLLNSVVAVPQKPSSPTPESTGKARPEDHVFQSASLNRDMHYLVLLPRDYTGGRRFPVLYLLHGVYGDYKNWDTRTRLEAAAESLPLLIVMPDADDSWYTNSATKPADKFEDYIAKDLISEIDGKYRTIRQKQSRAIAGLSMGGYGAVKLALKHPDLFAFAGSLSGAFNAAQNLDDLRPEFRTKLLEVFGPAGNRIRSENDIFLLLPGAHDDLYFYLACGADDFFRETNRALAGQLSARKIRYEYHETPGGHDWGYWDSALTPMLEALARNIDEAQKQR